MRPVTMEGESRLPAASTTSDISTLSTNDLVFHTVLCISWSLLPVKGVDFTFFNVRAKNFTFSHLCYEFKKLVMSTSDNRTELLHQLLCLFSTKQKIITHIHTWLIHLNLKLVYYWTCLRFLNEMMYCLKTIPSNTKVQILEQTQIHATCSVDGWSGWCDVPRTFLMLFFILGNPACSNYNSFVKSACATYKRCLLFCSK